MKGIVLTFDDGPNPQYTPQLLDLLQKYNVKASFFVVGSKAQKYPWIIERMVREGHTIGIHHFKHISGWILSPRQLKRQLKLTEKVIRQYTQEPVTYYRPPWGHFNVLTPVISKSYRIVMWSHIFGDWKVENAKNRLLDALRSVDTDGSILLLHDCGETAGADIEAPKYMIENLALFLEESRQQGVHFITLRELQANE